jgi:hypothetical protein
MSYLFPYKIENIDLNNIIFTKIKTHNTKKIILIKYNDNNMLNNLVFQTPTLLNLYEPINYDNYHEIEIGLLGKKNRKVDQFINFLNSIENKIKKEAGNNAYNWFNINNNNNSDITLKKIIRGSDEIKKGTFKLKILNNKNFKTLLQSNNTNINISNIQSNTWTKMILEFYAIWINNNNEFGIYLRPILISYSLLNNYNYNMIEDSESESESENDIPETEINNNIFMKNNNEDINKLIDTLANSQIKDLETDINLEFSNDIVSNTSSDNI